MNDLCPCGSGKEYKDCCQASDAEQYRRLQAQVMLDECEKALGHPPRNMEELTEWHRKLSAKEQEHLKEEMRNPERLFQRSNREIL
jgi:hypothetical protein